MSIGWTSLVEDSHLFWNGLRLQSVAEAFRDGGPQEKKHGKCGQKIL